MSNLKFGMPALIEIKSIEAGASLCHELGLDFIELNMNLPMYQAGNMNVNQLSKLSEKYSIDYTIHLEEKLNPFDFNELTAAAYRETVLKTIEIAKRISVPVLNMHLAGGVYFTLPDKKVYLFEEYQDDYLQKVTAFREMCTNAIGNENIKICVENCGDFARPKADYFSRGLEILLESPAFALTFDIGHNAHAGYSDEPVIMNHAGKLFHFHIHDAGGKKIHLALGDGEIDLDKYIHLVKRYHARAVVEVKTIEGLRRSVTWLGENGHL